MSEARKLVEVIDQLERQSEELNSAIDLYRQINSLYVEISNTSLKYEKVFDDMDKAKSYLKDASMNIKNNLESINHEEKLDDIILNINKISSNTLGLIEDSIKLNANINDVSANIKFLKSDIKDIDKNNEKIYDRILNLKEILEGNRSYYTDEVNKSLKKLEESILVYQDTKKDEIIDNLNNKINVMEKNYNKNMKNIYIILGIILLISVVNIFI